MNIRFFLFVFLLFVGCDHTQATKRSPISNDSLITFGTPRQGLHLVNRSFIVGYDGATRQPKWTLNKSVVGVESFRMQVDFHEDSRIPQEFRVSPEDYRGSGFDRGHLVPASDMETLADADDSFSMANISPQYPSFNRGIWKRAEQFCDALKGSGNAVFVMSGPIFDYRTPVEIVSVSWIPVPTHFWKSAIVISDDGEIISTWSVVIPHLKTVDHSSLKDYRCSIDDIERMAGIDLWPNAETDESAP